MPNPSYPPAVLKRHMGMGLRTGYRWLPALILMLLGPLAHAQDSTDFIRPYLFQFGGSGSLFSQVTRPQTAGVGLAPQSSLGFELAPRFSYLFSYSYGVGADLLLNYSLREDNYRQDTANVQVRQDAVSFSFVPDITYYLGVVPRLYGVAQLGAGLTLGSRTARQIDPATTLVQRRFDYQSIGPVVQVGTGLLYFVRPVLALQLQALYRVSLENLTTTGTPLRPDDLMPIPGRYMNNRLMVRVGFALYLTVKKKQRPGAAETESKQGPGKKAKGK